MWVQGSILLTFKFLHNANVEPSESAAIKKNREIKNEKEKKIKEKKQEKSV